MVGSCVHVNRVAGDHQVHRFLQGSERFLQRAVGRGIVAFRVAIINMVGILRHNNLAGDERFLLPVGNT